MQLDFTVQAKNGLLLCSYKNGLLNAADYRAKMANIKKDVPVTSPEVQNILAAVTADDEVEVASLIEHVARYGSPIEQAA